VLGATVTFTLEGHPAGDVQAALARRHINVSLMDAASARLDLDARGIAEMVRASVHYFNTDDEIDLLVQTVAAL
jgi:selenocysteine lyase/cysteine desulfurase